MATNFALTTSSPPEQIIQSLNYALANMNTGTTANVTMNGNILIANTTTGQISTISSNGTGTPVGLSYLYGYVDVMYANSATGGSGFSSNCTQATYYGVRNTQSPVLDTNPVDYAWIQVAGGFGSSNGLWYTTQGGGQISFAISTAKPSAVHLQVPDATPILLAALTGNLIVPGTVTNVQIATSTITGNLIAQNTITGNLVAAATITGNLVAAGTLTGNLIQANTITGNLIQANTIQATSIVAGSITATQLSANVLNVGNIISYGSTIDSNTGTGYWMDYLDGGAYFGGNIRIGNNLSVGNNAVIGGNVTVGNLIATGFLANAIVTTSVIVSQAVSQGIGITSVSPQTLYSGTTVDYTSGQATITVSYPAEQMYISGSCIAEFIVSYPSALAVTYSLWRGTTSTPMTTLLTSQTINLYCTGTTDFTPTFQFFDIPYATVGTVYVYSMAINYTNNGLVTSALIESGTLVCQVMKR